MNQNGVVCLPGPALLFFIFRFEYLISGPKSYRDIRETGPWRLNTKAANLFSRKKIHVLMSTVFDAKMLKGISQEKKVRREECKMGEAGAVWAPCFPQNRV